MTEIQPDVFCFRRILEVEAEEVDSLDDIYGLVFQYISMLLQADEIQKFLYQLIQVV